MYKVNKRILAIILMLTILATSISTGASITAQASITKKELSKIYLNTSVKYLHVKGETKNNYTFKVKKGAKHTWYVKTDKGNPDSVVVNKKTGLVTAKNAGTAYVRCKVTLADGSILRPEAKVVVRNNIKEVEIKNIPKDSTIIAGKEYDFDRTILNTDAGKGKKTQGITRWEIKDDTTGVGTATDKGVVLPMEAGTFKIRAVSFQSNAKYKKWLTNKNKYKEYITAKSDWATISVDKIIDEEIVTPTPEPEIPISSVKVSAISVKTSPTKITYKDGEKLDLTGLVVTLAKSNGTSEDIAFANFASKGITVSKANETVLATTDKKITVTHTESGKSIDQAITVEPILVSAISVKTSPTKITYKDGEKLDLTGLVVTLAKSNGTSEDIAFANFASKGITVSKANETVLATTDKKITVTHTESGKSIDQAITVEPILVSAISVSPETLTLTAGGATGTITATVSPAGATNKNVTWASSNTSVATVAGGVVTPLTAGTTTITATTVDGGFSKTVDVTVNPAPVTLVSIAITTPATKLAYNVGETLDIAGLVVTGTYSNSSTKAETITTANVSGFNSSTVAASQTLTVTVNGKMTSYVISIVKKAGPILTGVTADNVTNKVTGMAATMEFSTNGITWVKYNETTPNLPDLTGDVYLQVRFASTATHEAGAATTFNFTAATLESIAVKTSATKLVYKAGEALDITGLVIEGTYSDESKKDVAITAANVSGFDSTTVVASQTLTVTVDGKTTTYTVEIKAATLESIAIKTPATKLVYKVGETLDITGLVIEGTYSNGSKKNETITAANVTGFDSSAVVESQTLTVTVDGKTTTYTVEIKAATLVSIAVKTPATKLVYTLGETLDITGLVIEGTYSDASKKDETITSSNVTGFNSSAVVVSQTLTVTVDGKTTTYTVEIKPAATLSSIAVKMPATKLVYAVGETLDITGLVIEGTYSDSSKRIITITSSNVSGFNSSAVVASQALTVTVDGKTTTYTVEIQAVSVTGVSLNQTTMSLKVGTGTGTLTATIAPANATNKTVTWESSNTSVATVDSNGKVTPVAVGETTITVKTTDGNYEATCTVTVTAANIATQVFVGGNGLVNTLNNDYPYWVNGARSKTGTLGSGGCTAFFDHLTGILTLRNYTGGAISSGLDSGKDFIVKLEGINTVNGASTGISNGGGGDIYITADNDATLNVITSSEDNFSYAIATGYISGYTSGSVIIGGKAKVTVTATSTSHNKATGIQVGQGDVTIQEDARFTATLNADLTNGESIGIKTQKLIINTTGDIEIDCSNSKNGIVLYPSSLDIVNVNLMTLKAPTDGGFIFGSPVLPGVAVNEAGKVASYRSGTPYTIEVKNGEITGVAAGVIVQAGQPYQALANDIITIKAKEISNFAFVKWTNQDGTDLDSALFVSPTAANSSVAKIKMPAKDLNIKAEYKSTLFVTQPSFHRGDAKVTWKISQAANGYLQKKNVGVWEGFGTSITSDIGVGNKDIDRIERPDGTYRLKLTISSAPVGFGDHYSEEFEILWNAELDGTVTISGTPKYGETLTANVTGTQPDAGELKYQWYADTVEIGTNSNALTLGVDQIGKQIKVKVSSHNYNLPIESAATVAVAKADGPAAIDSYTGTSEVETNIKLAGLGASTPNLEVAVAIDGSTYDEYGNLFVDGDGKASIFGLTGVNASTKVKVRIKESPTHFAGADREITVTVAADTTPPVITASDKILPIANLASWKETVSAIDDVDGVITANVVATYFESDGKTSLTDLDAAKTYIDDASVNTSFVIKYNVKDAAGNAATEVVVTITVTKANIPDSIQVGSSILNSTNPYLVDGTPATTGTLGAGNCTAHFDPITGVLSLQDYVGGKIHINEAGKDLSIKLIGNANKITGGQFGIHNDKGDIYITSDNEALLEIEINSSFDGAAIANGWMTMTENPSVFIGGEVKLTIKAEYTGEKTTNSITGIYAGRGSVIIQDQADYSATLTNSEYQGRGISSNGKTIINTSGNIEIDVSNSLQGIGIYGNSGIEIQQVNSMLITIPSTGGTNTKFTSGTVDVSSGVAVNKSTTKASYRSGTPYTLGLEGGNITSATGGVIGSPHQYLVDDVITIQSTISEANFDRWTKANGAALEISLFTGGATANSSAATIKMPAESLNIKAREKETGKVIDIAAIPGVVAPVKGATPVTTITETEQYTGTVAWSPIATKFAGDTAYTATITLVANSGFKLDGVTANFFKVAGATTVTNEADTGEIIAEFPATAADTLINIAEIPGVVAPVTGKTPVTKINDTEQYTGTVEWLPADTKFAAETVYTATIKLTAKPGFTLTGVAANFFRVNGIATTYVAGVVTVKFPATAASDFAAGSGTLGDPYEVATAEQLNKVRNYPGNNVYFKQTGDIDLTAYLASDGAGYNEGKGWVPIGKDVIGERFNGNYDGGGFDITGLTIVSSEDCQGLFGNPTQYTNLKNINLTGVNIKGKSFVGGLIGNFGFGQLENCHVSGKVEGTGNFVGGLAGIYNNSNVGEGMKNCSTSVDVIGINYVGGLAGKSGYTTIDSCYSKGSVTGVDIVGGLVGNVASELNVKVTNSYSLASVTATGINGCVGGLVGLNQKAIENCYAAGQVTGNGTNAGGLVGENKGTINSSYYDIDTTGQSDTGKGDGKTTSEMMKKTTFSGWDFETIWTIVEDSSYPTLK